MKGERCRFYSPCLSALINSSDTCTSDMYCLQKANVGFVAYSLSNVSIYGLNMSMLVMCSSMVVNNNLLPFFSGADMTIQSPQSFKNQLVTPHSPIPLFSCEDTTNDCLAVKP